MINVMTLKNFDVIMAFYTRDKLTINSRIISFDIIYFIFPQQCITRTNCILVNFALLYTDINRTKDTHQTAFALSFVKTYMGKILKKAYFISYQCPSRSNYIHEAKLQ